MSHRPLRELLDRFGTAHFSAFPTLTSSEAHNRLCTGPYSLPFYILVLAAYYGLTYLKGKMKINAAAHPPVLIEETQLISPSLSRFQAHDDINGHVLNELGITC